jgi:prefoldin subunit 5
MLPKEWIESKIAELEKNMLQLAANMNAIQGAIEILKQALSATNDNAPTDYQ